MSSEPKEVAPKSGEPPRPAFAEFGADAELVLTALGRMVASLRGERGTLERLHAALSEAAGAIAEAKAAMQMRGPAGGGVDVGTLLDELEHRIDAMMEIVTGGPPGAAAQAAVAAAAVASAPVEAPPPETATPEAALLDDLTFVPVGAEPEQPMSEASPDDGPEPAPAVHDRSEATPAPAERVPTVSGVVSRLGRAGDGAALDDAAAAGGGESGDVPTVSMLQAMVQALNAAAPEAAPAAEDLAAAAPQPDPAPAVAAQVGFTEADEIELEFAQAEVAPAEVAQAEVAQAEVMQTGAAPGDAAETGPPQDEPAPDAQSIAAPAGIGPAVAEETLAWSEPEPASEEPVAAPVATGPVVDLDALAVAWAEPDTASFTPVAAPPDAVVEPVPAPLPEAALPPSEDAETAAGEVEAASWDAPADPQPGMEPHEASDPERYAETDTEPPPLDQASPEPASAADDGDAAPPQPTGDAVGFAQVREPATANAQDAPRQPPQHPAARPTDPLAPLKAMSASETIALFS
jgi:nicotinate-nucleotide--dimethylbenzimidazole phosphoribosyltransferase